MKQKMSASFSVAPAASASSRALADEDQPAALFYANGLHLSFPVFKFMLVCCQHSAVSIVTRLQYLDSNRGKRLFLTFLT